MPVTIFGQLDRSQRFAAVAAGLAQEQATVDSAEQLAALAQVGHQQLCGGGAEGHLAGAFRLGRLRSQVDQRPGRFQVLRLQRHQLLAAQRAVVGEGHHQPVAHRLVLARPQDPVPGVLVGNPRRLLHPPHQALLRMAASAAGLSTPDRAAFPDLFLDREVIEDRNPTIRTWIVDFASPTPPFRLSR
jgi:hypothetical protein